MSTQTTTTLLDAFLSSRKNRSDQEFLPAALSILETPPSPVKVWLIWTICLLFAFALAWSYFGRIDIIATAQGKIQPTGRVKTVQPVESGHVRAIRADNGMHVSKGDLLVELDATENRADEAASTTALLSSRAESLRRSVALDAAESRKVSPTRTVAWPDSIPTNLQTRENRVLRGDLGNLSSAIRSLDAQIAQKGAEEGRLKATIYAQEILIATLKERVMMRATLADKGAGSKASLIDGQETLETQQTTLATQKGQLIESRAAAQVLAQEREKAFGSFIVENGQKLADAERQIEDLEQKVAKAHEKTSHTTIFSPIDGTIIGLSVTTIGQFVNAGEEIMRIVPDASALEIECYAENKDIGFIEAGESAVVKIESFPFTRYGTLTANVIRVAHDAIPEPDAQTTEANPAKTTKASYFGGAQRTQNLVFPVTLTPERRTMMIDGLAVPLTPGMAVSVEIKTGRRRILEYLFSPLVETASRALKER